MMKTGLLVAVAAATALAGDPAWGDASPDPHGPFPDGPFVTVDDDTLDREVGFGLAGGDLPRAMPSEDGRQAVILWDEARPPATPPPIRNTLQANGRVVVSVGHSHNPGS